MLKIFNPKFQAWNFLQFQLRLIAHHNGCCRHILNGAPRPMLNSSTQWISSKCGPLNSLIQSQVLALF